MAPLPECEDPLIPDASARPFSACLDEFIDRWSYPRAMAATFGVSPGRSGPALMVVTSAGLVDGRGHREVAAAAIAGGAGAVQLRAPGLPGRDLLPLAADLASACRAAGTLFIVNDRVDVAVAAAADGVHLGQGDQPGHARAFLCPGMVLGVSVETPEQARRAARSGAAYLGVTVWRTATKPGATPVGLNGLRAVCAATCLPVIGIGGIDAGNAAQVLAAGARGVAVVSAVGAAGDMVAATRALAAAVERSCAAAAADRVAPARRAEQRCGGHSWRGWGRE